MTEDRELVEIPAFREFGKIPRLSREVVVTEKLDGTNAVVYVDQSRGLVLAGCRTRWITPGKQTDNYGFAAWVKEREASLAAVLGDGTHFGEWWGQGIQRRYGLTEKRLSLFNVKKWGWLDDSAERAFRVGPDLSQLHVVPVLWRGDFDITMIEAALADLKQHGSKAAPGFMDPEGVVVFHSASSTLFKKTLKNDEHKGENA